MTPAPSRRWSYSLRTLFVVVTACAIVFGSFAAFPIEAASVMMLVVLIMMSVLLMLFGLWCSVSTADAIANLVDYFQKRRDKKALPPPQACTRS
jgi:hypothetical protein